MATKHPSTNGNLTRDWPSKGDVEPPQIHKQVKQTVRVPNNFKIFGAAQARTELLPGSCDKQCRGGEAFGQSSLPFASNLELDGKHP